MYFHLFKNHFFQANEKMLHYNPKQGIKHWILQKKLKLNCVCFMYRICFWVKIMCIICVIFKCKLFINWFKFCKNMQNRQKPPLLRHLWDLHKHFLFVTKLKMQVHTHQLIEVSPPMKIGRVDQREQFGRIKLRFYLYMYVYVYVCIYV